MKKIDRAIRILSQRLDMIHLPEKQKDALLIAEDLEVLREARILIQENEKEQYDEQDFSDWDHGLLRISRNAHCEKHRDVLNLCKHTESEEARVKIKAISGLLRDTWRKERL